MEMWELHFVEDKMMLKSLNYLKLECFYGFNHGKLYKQTKICE